MGISSGRGQDLIVARRRKLISNVQGVIPMLGWAKRQSGEAVPEGSIEKQKHYRVEGSGFTVIEVLPR
jgi:hypothetical protein